MTLVISCVTAKDRKRGPKFWQQNGLSLFRGDAMKFIRNTTRNLGVAGELFSFFWGNKRWWLIPMIVVLFLLGAMIVLAQSSAIAPFIYTLF
jgi:hypothetical protein